MKELIDMYSGPDVVAAKQQQEELQRVANTLPDNIPSSVKQFIDKTLLSLKVCLLITTDGSNLNSHFSNRTSESLVVMEAL